MKLLSTQNILPSGSSWNEAISESTGPPRETSLDEEGCDVIERWCVLSNGYKTRVAAKTWNDPNPPKTNYNQLKPPEPTKTTYNHLRPPSTTWTTKTTWNHLKPPTTTFRIPFLSFWGIFVTILLTNANTHRKCCLVSN